MNALDRTDRALAAALAALAGFVDAIGFLGLGGFFVSFMSGNSTRLGVGVASEGAAAAVAAALVGAFVVGVLLGALLCRATGRFGRTAVLALVALSLGLAAMLYQPGAVPGAFLLVALAMGAENMVFQRNGDVAFGLTYMTGTLVRIGQRLADALAGGAGWDWLPWALLWAGLVAGGVIGALAWLRIGADALWIAAALAAVLAVASLPRQSRPTR